MTQLADIEDLDDDFDLDDDLDDDFEAEIQQLVGEYQQATQRLVGVLKAVLNILAVDDTRDLDAFCTSQAEKFTAAKSNSERWQIIQKSCDRYTKSLNLLNKQRAEAIKLLVDTIQNAS